MGRPWEMRNKMLGLDAVSNAGGKSKDAIFQDTVPGVQLIDWDV